MAGPDDDLRDDLPLTVDPVHGIAIITWPAEEEPTILLSRHTFKVLRAHPHFRPDMGILADARGVTRPPSMVFVSRFVARLTKLTKSGEFVGRFATVVPRQHLAVYGMSRMAEIRSLDAQLNYRAFVDYDEAIAWLKGTKR